MEHLVELLRHPSLNDRTLCMGILNITPDSFHDGGAYLQIDKALEQFDLLVEQGVDMIDIGGMSSRPGHTKISAQKELQRILPVIECCAGRSTIPISVDTDRVEVAAAALSAGVRILNDCSGRLDSPLFALAARTQVPIVIMHRHGVEGRHANIVEEVMAFFSSAMAAAQAVGVQDEQFILDPGLGFYKNVEENIALVKAIPRLHSFGRPLLIGYSHKRFVADLSGEVPGNTPVGNAVLAAYCVQKGVQVVRVHEPDLFLPIARAYERLR